MADNQGWVKLYRQLLDKPIWLNSRAEHQVVLITLLLMANHAPSEWEWKGEKYTLMPGQMITSVEKIMAKCGVGVTRQNVRSALKRLEKLNFLTNKSTNKNRLITIVNWGLFQGAEVATNQVTNQQVTGNQPTANRLLTTNKNVKNKEKDKNEENTTTPTTQKYLNSGVQNVVGGISPEPQSKVQQARESVFSYWEQNGFGMIPPKLFEDVDKYADDFKQNGTSEAESYQLIEFALSEAVNAGARRWNYVRGTLNNMLADRVTSVHDATNRKAQWEAQQTDKRKTTNSAQISAEERLKQIGKESSHLPF